MPKSNLKLKIHREQLKWFLAMLLNERELFKILMNTKLVSDPDKLYSSSKHELLNRLTNAFFRESDIDEIVIEHLSQKVEKAISRVGYMVEDEIHTFFKSPGPLIESGEFAEVVWALLTDSREKVHTHGFHLLNTAYDTYNVPNVCNGQFRFVDNPTQPKVPSTQIQDIQTNYSDEDQEAQIRIDDLKSNLELLESDYSELKEKFAAIEKKNKLLEQHCQFLTDENQKYKTKVNAFKDIEKKIVYLQQENDNFHEKEAQYAETEVSLLKLDAEHQQLIRKYDQISLELNELSQIKTSKEAFTVELKLVEEAVYRQYQTYEEFKSNLQKQAENFEKSHEASRNALNNIRQTVSQLNIQQEETIEVSEKETTQPRVGVFVDVQNMFYAAKDRFERRVDYIKLLDLIVGPRQLISAYAYIVQIPEIDQSNFFSLLEHNGYTIRSKDLRLRGDGSAKGDWDVGIAVDVVSMLSSLDVVILASGDGDFCPLAELIKQQHKRIEVVAFEHNTSMDLQSMADQFFPIGEELLM